MVWEDGGSNPASYPIAAAEFVDGAVAVSGGAPPGQTDEDVSMVSQVYRLIFGYL